jgi:hypothetical protein
VAASRQRSLSADRRRTPFPCRATRRSERIPIVVREADDGETLELALIETCSARTSIRLKKRGETAGR